MSDAIKDYLGSIAIECISLGQRKDETIIEFIRRLADKSDAAISVARERKALEERERHRTRAIGDRSDWPKDGFINDTD